MGGVVQGVDRCRPIEAMALAFLGEALLEY